MTNNNSSQKFIARNRAPRVQIEYDVEIYGSEKKIELPFVMGVLADLSGKPSRLCRRSPSASSSRSTSTTSTNA
jgi:type VI secretion system protein ImpB